MVYPLTSRNVLITGGSRGIGEAISIAFAREGCNIIINYVSNSERALTLESNLRSLHPDAKIFAVQGDVSTKAGCERLVDETVEKLGGLDVICSNAGWTKFEEFGDLDALSEEDWDRCFAVNVKAHLHLFRRALPIFNSNPSGGVFLNCSSVAGMQPGGSSMAYSTTKAAALHLMRCLTASQGPKVRINSILPGLVLTEWGSQFSEQKKEGIKQMSKLKKYTDVNDVAEAFVFAARNESMTGQRISVDAGLVP